MSSGDRDHDSKQPRTAPRTGLVEDSAPRAGLEGVFALSDLNSDKFEILPSDYDPTSGRPSGRLRRSMSHVRGGRGAAIFWLHAIIAVVVGVYVFGAVAYAEPATVSDLQRIALRAAALWALALMPGWLYLRSLAVRSYELWNEYVLALHRLGWDQPENLPRPPRASRYYEEWLDSGGEKNPLAGNQYSLKFSAYHGASVADTGDRTVFAVRGDAVSSVFLATAILSTIWAAFLWPTGSLESPKSLWDVLRFAFLGSYAMILQSLIRRYFWNDLRPAAYVAAVYRVIASFVVVIVLFQLASGHLSYRVMSVIAFVIGAFPMVGLTALQRLIAIPLRTAVPSLSSDYPLSQLDGLTVWYESRLIEEGIEDAQNLVSANLADVVLHTRVPVGRLIDWIDQAHLILHLDRQARGLIGGASTSGREQPPSGRAVRRALRQLGIRKATDLLSAFPLTELEGASSGLSKGPQMAKRLGIDADRLRVLVRVLDESFTLQPVWNWYERGTEMRTRGRRPSGTSVATASVSAKLGSASPSLVETPQR